MSDALLLLRAIPSWGPAVDELRVVELEHGARAQQAAQDYAAVYQGCRGAMIVDVVASRQRSYSSRVRKIASRWKEPNSEHTIAWLAEHPLDPKAYGPAAAEVETIRTVAENLRQFATVEGLMSADDEDAGRIGFDVPNDDHAAMVVARAAAAEIGVSDLVLDQLLRLSG